MCVKDYTSTNKLPVTWYKIYNSRIFWHISFVKVLNCLEQLYSNVIAYSFNVFGEKMFTKYMVRKFFGTFFCKSFKLFRITNNRNNNNNNRMYSIDVIYSFNVFREKMFAKYMVRKSFGTFLL